MTDYTEINQKYADEVFESHNIEMRDYIVKYEVCFYVEAEDKEKSIDKAESLINAGMGELELVSSVVEDD